MSLLVRNLDHVVTLDDQGTVLKNVDIRVDGNRITAIGKGLSAEGADVIDGSGRIALPGMVNTHHHLFQSLTRCVPAVQDEELFGWLTTLYTIWQDLTPEGVYAGTLLGLAELLLTGCTTSTDMYYLFPRSGPPDMFDQQIRAANDLGIRFHPTRGSMSMGKSQGGLPPDDVCQDEDVIMADCERIIKQYHDPDPLGMVKIALAPCAPFTVTQQLMKDSVTLARRNGVRLHTHLAETKDEEVYCQERYGCRPFEFVERLGWVGSDVWFAHAVYLNQREIDTCGKTGTGIAHCPVSNMRLGSGIAPIPEMLAAGVPVGLGVDGSSSNDSGDMLGEVRACLLSHRIRTGVKSMTAERALRVGIQGGARVLGYSDIGTLAPGKAADFIVVNLNQIGYACASVHDPVAALVMTGDSHVVETSVVNGRVVVKDGRLALIPEDRVISLANRVASEMLQKAHKRTGIDYWKRREAPLHAS
ncbi:MAG TPA: 8-oxoguanine deaminase [Candidatus Xenobia bacterium]